MSFNYKRPDLTPLMIACIKPHMDVLRLLLTSGAPIDRQTPNGEAALHIAATLGHKEAVELLLDAGADPSLKTQNGESAVNMAEAAGFQSIADLIKYRQKQTAKSRPSLNGLLGTTTHSERRGSHPQSEAMKTSGPR